MSIGHLTLRLAVIGGQTAPDDYSVLEDGAVIGRILRATERKGEVWTWSVTAPIPGVANGSAASLDEAKHDFRASWTAFKATVDPDQLAQALAGLGGCRLRTRMTSKSMKPARPDW
jgi:hypothetical protein